MTHTFKANFSQARQRMMPNYKLTQTIYKLLAPFTVETKTELTRVAAVKVQTLTQTTWTEAKRTLEKCRPQSKSTVEQQLLTSPVTTEHSGLKSKED
jgi:hypothetical protein